MTISSINSTTAQNMGSVVPVRKLSEEEIRNIAIQEPNKKVAQVRNNAMYTLFFGIPVADSLFNAVMTKGPLFQKSSSFAKNIGRWAGIFALSTGLLGARKAITNRSEKLREFEQKNPAVSYGLDIALLITAFGFAKHGYNKLKNVVKEKFPTLLKDFDKKFSQTAKRVLNNSQLNKKYIKSLDKYLEANPYAQKAGKFMTLTIAPIMALATFIRFNKEVNSAVKQANQNYFVLSTLNDLIQNKDSKQTETPQEK